VAIAMSLTSYAGPEPEVPAAAAHLLDLGGLRQVVQFLDRLRAEDRLSTMTQRVDPDQAPEARYD